MGAPIGNQFWKIRSKHGRDKILTDPKLFAEECDNYFQLMDNNPAYKSEAIKSGDKTGDIIDIPMDKPYSLAGLSLYLGLHEKYFYDFEKGLEGKDDEISKDFSEIISRVRDIIRVQKYTGAVVGVFNPKIIAVELGLNETLNVNQSGKTTDININVNGKDIDITSD